MNRPPGLYAAATVVLAMVWLGPHILHPLRVPDRGDPVFSAWRIARFGRQITRDPRRLFDGNIFYPRRWTLAYSDATLLESAAGAPFLAAGAEPLLVANALFLIAFPLCGLAFFYAGWRLTGDRAAALVTGVLGAWYPFHGEHYSHLELQWFMFVPLAFVAALEVIAEPTWRKGIVLGGLVALQSLASMYLGLMLACALGPLVLVRLAFSGVSRWRDRAAALAVSVIVVAPVVVALAIPYERARADHGDRSAAEIEQGSAVAGDYLSTSRRLTAYSWHERAANRPERELFPGTSTVALAAVGVMAGPLDVVLPIGAAAAAAFDWSLGVHGATYGALKTCVPPFRNVRVPARFAVVFGSALILLAARGVRSILRRSGKARPVVLVAIAAGVLFDLRLTSLLVDYYPAVPSAYERVGPDAVLAEFPLGHEIDGMYFSTTRWPNLLSGYSGFVPFDAALSADLAAFPEPAAIDRLRARGTTHIVYNCEFERSPERCEFNGRQLAANPALELISEERWMDATVRLYRFR